MKELCTITSTDKFISAYTKNELGNNPEIEKHSKRIVSLINDIESKNIMLVKIYKINRPYGTEIKALVTDMTNTNKRYLLAFEEK